MFSVDGLVIDNLQRSPTHPFFFTRKSSYCCSAS